MIPKIPLYTIYSSSHEPLYRDWFLPTLPENDFEVIEYNTKDETNGFYQSHNWLAFITKKIDFLIRAARENMNKIFMFSDVDIQFFQSFKDTLVTKFIESDLDFVSQRDYMHHCTGFFITRGSDTLIETLYDAKDLMKLKTMDDQVSFNTVKNYTGLKCGFLGTNYYNVGLLMKERVPHFIGWNWTDKVKINEEDIPKEIIMHHGNWTTSIEDKIKLMTIVKNIVNNRKINKVELQYA